MTEKDTNRSELRFWSFGILWLVPWVIISVFFLYLLFTNRLPHYNICKSDLDNILVFLTFILVVLLMTTPLLGAILVRWGLRRWLLRRIWHVIRILGLILSLLFIYFLWLSTQYMDQSNQSRALVDCRNISTAFLLFHKDTGTWPYYCTPFDDPDYEPCIDYLYGNMGDMPDIYEPIWDSWGTVGDDMLLHLVQNGRERPLYLLPPPVTGDGEHNNGWKGPYLPYVTDDPWAHKYLVSVGAFEGGTLKAPYVWCISAGKNWCLETPTTATEPQGDDIGYRIK